MGHEGHEGHEGHDGHLGQIGQVVPLQVARSALVSWSSTDN